MRITGNRRPQTDGFAPLESLESATQSTGLATGFADRFLPRTECDRLAVLALTPSLRPISRQKTPEGRNRAICEASPWDVGPPMRFPLVRAFRKPAFTRSTIRLRSNSA